MENSVKFLGKIMPTISIKTNNRELVNLKFTNTIQTVQGYLTEARGDMEVDQDYTARAVKGRIERIKEALEQDLENLAKDIV